MLRTRANWRCRCPQVHCGRPSGDLPRLRVDATLRTAGHGWAARSTSLTRLTTALERGGDRDPSGLTESELGRCHVRLRGVEIRRTLRRETRPPRVLRRGVGTVRRPQDAQETLEAELPQVVDQARDARACPCPVTPRVIAANSSEIRRRPVVCGVVRRPTGPASGPPRGHGTWGMLGDTHRLREGAMREESSDVEYRTYKCLRLGNLLPVGAASPADAIGELQSGGGSRA